MRHQKLNSLTRDAFESPLRTLLMGEAEPTTSSRSSTLRGQCPPAHAHTHANDVIAELIYMIKKIALTLQHERIVVF